MNCSFNCDAKVTLESTARHTDFATPLLTWAADGTLRWLLHVLLSQCPLRDRRGVPLSQSSGDGAGDHRAGSGT